MINKQLFRNYKFYLTDSQKQNIQTRLNIYKKVQKQIITHHLPNKYIELQFKQQVTMEKLKKNKGCKKLSCIKDILQNGMTAYNLYSLYLYCAQFL